MFMDEKTHHSEGVNSPQMESTHDAIPIKISRRAHRIINKLIKIFIQKDTDPRIATTVLKIKNKVGGNSVS